MKEAESFQGKPRKYFEASTWTGFRSSEQREQVECQAWQKMLWGGRDQVGLMMARHETSFHYIYIYVI